MTKTLAEVGQQFKPEQFNTAISVEKIDPKSQIGQAIDLLRYSGEQSIRPEDITLIPIKLENNNSTSVVFANAVAGEGKPKKGFNLHTLRIQSVGETEIAPGTIQSATTLGFDTAPGSLVGIVNGRRKIFFHTSALVVSEETTEFKVDNNNLAAVPLFVPIPFTDGDKVGVLIVSRFPKDYIHVDSTPQKDFPVGEVDPNANRMSRSPAVAPPFKAPPAAESPVKSAPEKPFVDVDKTVAEMIKAWTGGKYNQALAKLSDVQPPTYDKKVALKYFETTFTQGGQISDTDRMFVKIARKVLELQENYENADKNSLVFVDDLAGGQKVKKINLALLDQNTQEYQNKYGSTAGHNADNYAEYLARWQIKSGNWAVNKRWGLLPRR